MPMRLLTEDERPALRAFVAARNRPGGQLCLHLADRPEEVAADLAELEPLTSRCLVLDDGPGSPWRGAIVWEVGGPAGDRAWLVGPWTAPLDGDLHAALIEAAVARLPGAVTRIDNFVDLGFEIGCAVHRRLGFDARRTVHVMRADAHRAVPPPAGVRIEAVESLETVDRVALEALHDAAFPDTHTAVSGMLGSGRLWCARADGIAGYVYAVRPAELPEGRVQYVAVAPGARRRGIGRALLSTAVAWLLEGGAPEVFLTVDAENVDALNVYRAAGFERYRSGVAFTALRAAGG